MALQTSSPPRVLLLTAALLHCFSFSLRERSHTKREASPSPPPPPPPTAKTPLPPPLPLFHFSSGLKIRSLAEEEIRMHCWLLASILLVVKKTSHKL